MWDEREVETDSSFPQGYTFRRFIQNSGSGIVITKEFSMFCNYMTIDPHVDPEMVKRQVQQKANEWNERRRGDICPVVLTVRLLEKERPIAANERIELVAIKFYSRHINRDGRTPTHPRDEFCSKFSEKIRYESVDGDSFNYPN